MTEKAFTAALKKTASDVKPPAGFTLDKNSIQVQVVHKPPTVQEEVSTTKSQSQKTATLYIAVAVGSGLVVTVGMMGLGCVLCRKKGSRKHRTVRMVQPQVYRSRYIPHR